MSSGYNISCEPGALGMQTCYVNVNTPTGCTTGSPGCTTTKQEIIGYTAAGQPISKGKSTSSWMAFVPQVTTLNNKGQAYQPYGPAGIPYSLQGGSLVKWNPTDMQALAYLDSAPGAQARDAYQERVCSPLWSNVFGCREGDEAQTDQEIQSSGQNSVTAQQKGGIMSSNLAKAGIGVLTIGGLYFGYKKIKG